MRDSKTQIETVLRMINRNLEGELVTIYEQGKRDSLIDIFQMLNENSDMDMNMFRKALAAMVDNIDHGREINDPKGQEAAEQWAKEVGLDSEKEPKPSYTEEPVSDESNVSVIDNMEPGENGPISDDGYNMLMAAMQGINETGPTPENAIPQEYDEVVNSDAEDDEMEELTEETYTVQPPEDM